MTKLNTTNREVNGQYSNLKRQTNSSKQTNSKIYWRSTMVNPILHLNFSLWQEWWQYLKNYERESDKNIFLLKHVKNYYINSWINIAFRTLDLWYYSHANYKRLAEWSIRYLNHALIFLLCKYFFFHLYLHFSLKIAYFCNSLYSVFVCKQRCFRQLTNESRKFFAHNFHGCIVVKDSLRDF